MLPALQRPALVIVDEAHCISDWGHDFRPDYQRIARILTSLASPALGTTATANNRVIEDVRDQLGTNISIARGPLGRDSLSLQAIAMPRVDERLSWLAEHLPSIPGSGIIYTLTQRDALLVSDWLRSRTPTIKAPAYHALLETAEKEHLEQQLLQNEVKCLVATIALGMGFDKPDLGFVVHFQRPQSAIHYYQQIGRAGRAVDSALAILLSGDEDDEIIEYFISAPLEFHAQADRIYSILRDAPAPRTPDQLARSVNVPTETIESILNRMAVMAAAPVAHDGNRWYATGNPFQHDRAESLAIAEARRHENDRLRDYISSSTCLMEFLQRELDDPTAAPCGRCAACRRQPLVPTNTLQPTFDAAQAFLRTRVEAIDAETIRPKLAWPRGSSTHAAIAGPNPRHLRIEPGRAMTNWASPGLGNMVRHGKIAGKFSDELIDAAVEYLSQRWVPQPSPTWVTCVPSRRARNLVPDAAARVAARLGLPFRACILKLADNAPQKDMQNVFFQIRNLDGAFEIDRSELLPGPVLLIDDIVDSGWTLAVVGAMLREAGSGPIFPLTFGRTTPR